MNFNLKIEISSTTTRKNILKKTKTFNFYIIIPILIHYNRILFDLVIEHFLMKLKTAYLLKI